MHEASRRSHFWKPLRAGKVSVILSVQIHYMRVTENTVVQCCRPAGAPGRFPTAFPEEYHCSIPTNMKLLLASLLALPLLAQTPPPTEATAKPAPEEGIPVTDPLVI